MKKLIILCCIPALMNATGTVKRAVRLTFQKKCADKSHKRYINMQKAIKFIVDSQKAVTDSQTFLVESQKDLVESQKSLIDVFTPEECDDKPLTIEAEMELLKPEDKVEEEIFEPEDEEVKEEIKEEAPTALECVNNVTNAEPVVEEAKAEPVEEIKAETTTDAPVATATIEPQFGEDRILHIQVPQGFKRARVTLDLFLD